MNPPLPPPQNYESRALLVYGEAGGVEVLADQRAVTDGKEGEEQLRLAQLTWAYCLEILYPVAILMAVVVYFSGLFSASVLYSAYDGSTDYSYYLRDSSSSDWQQTEIALLIGGAMVAFMFLVAFCMQRYRERCEYWFKRFLVLDIALIYIIGLGSMLVVLAQAWSWPVDLASFSLVVWNVAVVGVVSLYHPVPPAVHRLSVALIHCIMAVMMLVTLRVYFILVFVGLAALVDVLAELRVMRFMSPFVIPPAVELVHDTPRILYTVGPLRLRSVDFMWFAMLAGSVARTCNSIASAILLILAALAIVTFVLPYCGKRFRPLPVAYVVTVVIILMWESLLVPALLAGLSLYTPVNNSI
jgi:hypothetical protein